MNNEYEEWKDVEFMYDASAKILETNYEEAILLLNEGIKKNLIENAEPVDSKRLLHTLRLLIATVQSSLEDNFSISLNELKKNINSENSCSFCKKSRSEVEVLVGGANGFICNICVSDISNNLKNLD